MELKALLKSFWQLISVFRFVGPQVLGVFFIAYALGELAGTVGIRGCPAAGSLGNVYIWVFLAAGIMFAGIAFYYILFPTVWMQKFDRQIMFSSSDVNVPFFSTQPVYVFVDAVLLIPGIALFQSGTSETMCRFSFNRAFGYSFLLLTLLFPLVRGFSWFVARRRIRARKPFVPWGTLVMFWMMAVPFTIYTTFNYLESRVYPRLRVPVVNENTFEGGLPSNPKFMTGIVRVQGTLVREIAKCGLFGRDPEKFPFPAGTVLLDMGKQNGQVMVKANRPYLVRQLEIEAERKMGQVFEAFGRLSRLPNPNKKLVCGIGKADSDQKGGLALLEMEMP